MRYITLLFLALFATNVFAQTLNEELGFIYVKAEYLMETNRYDEAIDEFTKIIAKSPSFKDALYQRALAKFNVGAFQGTYNDLMQVFELKGIDPASLLLFGKAQKNLGKSEAAAVTLATAGELYPNGTSAREKAENNRDTSSSDDRTEEGEEKSQVDKLKDQISNILEDLLPGTTTPGAEQEGTNDSETQDSDSDNRDRQTKGGRDRSTNNDSNSNGGSVLTPVDEPEPEPKVDDSVNEIYVDEDVTLFVKNGLGARRILEQPNILILSETSGTVVVDVCVNGNGKVTQAEYNAGESSLKTQSIISLAVRKSKEFWFKSAAADEMCGTIVYNITGSN